MPDPDQPGEDLDEDHLTGEYPPDEPLAAEDEGVTGLEQLGGESVAEREDRTEPEPWEQPPGPGDRASRPVVEQGAPPTDVEPDEEPLVPVEEPDPVGPLASDDSFTGDETTRDVIPEREPGPAEEAAVHVQDDDEAEVEAD